MRVVPHCDRCNKMEHIKQKLYYNVRTFIYNVLNNMLAEAVRNRMEIVDSERQTRKAGAEYCIRIPETRSAQKSMF